MPAANISSPLKWFLGLFSDFAASLYQFPSSPWASALDRYMVSALGSRAGWTPARKERTNDLLTFVSLHGDLLP